MLDLFFPLAAGNAIFLAFLVATVRRDENRVANRWLAVFLLLMGLFILDDVFLTYGVYQVHPDLIGWLGLFIFGLSPALYLCVSQFVAAERGFQGKKLWHFLPFFLLALLSAPYLLQTADSEKLAELKSTSFQIDDAIVLGLLALQVSAYLFFSFRKLQKHRKNIENITAAPESVRLDWLKYFLWGVAAMVLVWFAELSFLPVQADPVWFNLCYFIGIYALGYFALRQKEVFPFSEKEVAELGEIMAEAEHAPTARRLIFSDTELAQLKIRLLEKMDTEKPYLDSELNLPILARSMGMSLHELSELVNVGLGENFAQFVNRYRVEESQRLLLSAQHSHLSMVGIAFEAGFNSKTAFNTAFKKMLGISPTEFQKQQKMRIHS